MEPSSTFDSEGQSPRPQTNSNSQPSSASTSSIALDRAKQTASKLRNLQKLNREKQLNSKSQQNVAQNLASDSKSPTNPSPQSNDPKSAQPSAPAHSADATSNSILTRSPTESVETEMQSQPSSQIEQTSNLSHTPSPKSSDKKLTKTLQGKPPNRPSSKQTTNSNRSGTKADRQFLNRTAQKSAETLKLQRTTRSWRRDTPVPDNTNLRKLQKLDADLTNTLAVYQSGNRVRPRVQRMQTDDYSEWAYVDNSDVVDFFERIPQPALVFPFELDPFQKRAILHIEAQQSVFVAAHTSAGKTVVAEYAIALAASMHSKVFYTSPIKTLSNQKLRDFKDKFDDVGLVTGDVSINDNAQCVIMTTEILRSMLYRGADAIRDVSYVIFDEVQFLNDEERGVVWEESIIMLPPHIGIIMLSATVPNALEFAAWVGKTKNRRVAVVSTSHRPVPLEHAWLHPSRDNPEDLEATVLLKQGGPFLSKNYRSALNAQGGTKRKDGRGQRNKRTKKDAEKEDLENDDSKGSVLKHAQESLESDVERHEAKQSTSESEFTDKESSNNIVKHGNEETSSNRKDGMEDERDEEIGKKEWQPNSHAQSNDKVAQSSASRKQNVSSGASSSNKGPKGRNKNKAIGGKSAGRKGGKGDGPNSFQSPWTPVIKFVHENQLTPTVLFCFSKKKCEQAVEGLENSDLLPDSGDKALVHSFFDTAIFRLREEDRELPQVLRARTNLKRGISAHHAGLLPIIKEITEILFSKGLVKVLFATETFAMGVNMPARTVIFTGLRKNDGRRFRTLEAGEFTQMSGRAGRRGLDNVGHVYLFFPPDEKIPDEQPLRQVMTGEPISLKSAFRLTYNMILNVLRVDELRVEEMMKQSFSEAGEEEKAISITGVLDKASNTLDGIKNTNDSLEKPVSRRMRRNNEGLSAYVEKYVSLCSANSTLAPNDVLPVLKASIVPGRVVVARLADIDLLALGMVYSIVPDNNSRGRNREGRDDERAVSVERYTFLWLAVISGVEQRTIGDHPRSVLLLPEVLDRRQMRTEPRVVTSNGLIVCLRKVKASDIVYITAEVDEVDAERRKTQYAATRSWVFGQRALPAKRTLLQNGTFLQQVITRWRERLNGISESAEFVAGFGRGNDNGKFESKGRKTGKLKLSEAYKQREALCVELVCSAPMAMSVIGLPPKERKEKLETLIVEENIRKKMIALKTVSRTGSESSLLPEYAKRVEVLQKLKYVGEDGLSVQLKGRCACEVATADCIVLTEIVLESVLNGLSAAEVASLLSSLVCRKKNGAEVHKLDAKIYSKAYCEAKAAMRAVVENVGKAQEECGVDLTFDIGDSCDGFEGSMCRWDLAHAVYSWACGEPFCNITNLTEQQEGDIVVCVKRLSELLKDAEAVAKGVGNEELSLVLDEAITCIRRDVIFNGSLYLDEGE